MTQAQLDALFARITAVEARLSALEGSSPPSAGIPSSSKGNGRRRNGGGETFSLEMLDKPWANKKITKDPKNWKGRSQVGRRYSDAPSEWHEDMAGFFQWKAEKGRAEDPPRLRNDGKPWYESDEFEAKLCRTWAIANKDRPAPKKRAAAKPAEDDFFASANDAPVPTPSSADDEALMDAGDPDDIPF